MIKIKESNRGIFFLGGTVLIGVLLISVLVFYKTIVDQPPIPSQPPEGSTYKVLEQDIENFKYLKFNPSNYFTLSTVIGSNFQQGLITKTVKNNLILNLNAVYSGLVYNQCELYLMGGDSHKNTEILSWLSQLESITAKNTRINHYREQIKQHEYYSILLPKKVSGFIAGGTTNFVEAQYLKYKDEVSKMPNLDPKYFDTPKFKNVRSNLLSSLSDAYNQWAAL